MTTNTRLGLLLALCALIATPLLVACDLGCHGARDRYGASLTSVAPGTTSLPLEMSVPDSWGEYDERFVAVYFASPGCTTDYEGDVTDATVTLRRADGTPLSGTRSSAAVHCGSSGYVVDLVELVREDFACEDLRCRMTYTVEVDASALSGSELEVGFGETRPGNCGARDPHHEARVETWGR